MSQGSNYKAQVMEALSNAPTNLISNKAFLWAATNLPDEGGNGKFSKGKKPFDHTPDIDFWKAIGYSKQWAKEMAEEKLVKIFYDFAKRESEENPEEGNYARSKVLEELINMDDPEIHFFLMVAGFVSVYEGVHTRMASSKLSSDLDELKKHLDSLGKGDEIKIKAGTSKESASELSSEDDIPEDAPEELKELLRALISLKKRLGGDK
jgi:hypothetical protein